MLYICCTHTCRPAGVCVRELKVHGQDMDKIAAWGECCMKLLFMHSSMDNGHRHTETSLLD